MTEHHEAAEAATHIGADNEDAAEAFKRAPTPQDIGWAVGTVIGFSLLGAAGVLALIHLAHVYGFGPGLAALFR